MKDYYDLTERGRALRLRAAVEAAVALYDLEPARLRLITNETNGIFRLDSTDGRRLVARVGLGGEIAHSPGQVAAETEWLVALDADTSLTVPVPLPARDGSRFVTVEVPGVPDPRNVVLFSWLSGRVLEDRLSAGTMRSYGELAARLHEHGAGHRPSEPEALARYDRVHPFDEPTLLFDAPDDLLPAARRSVYLAARDRVAAALDRLIGSGEPMRILHGDLHVWNVMVSRAGLAPFDFEDSMRGWPIQDIATTMFYLHRRPEYGEWLSEFRRGYEAVAVWPERYEGEMDTFIIGRYLVLANGVLIAPEWMPLAAEYFERWEVPLRTLLA